VYQYHADQRDGVRFNYDLSSELGQGWGFDKYSFSVVSGNVHELEEMFPDLLVPVYKYHFDQSKTFGGWKFLYTPQDPSVTDGWTQDTMAFYGLRTDVVEGSIPIHLHYRVQDNGSWQFHLSADREVHGLNHLKVAFYGFP